MSTQRFVAYYRVSTAGQGRSGLGIEAQQAAVKAYLTGRDHQLVAEFTEVESGRKADRPKLAEALAMAKRQKAVLVIARLDRLARNVAFIASLMESKVEFIACDLPQATPFTLHIMAAVGEAEAKAISERTKAALAAAKERGVRLGNTTNLPVARAKGRETIIAGADDHAEKVLPVIREIVRGGITSVHKIADALQHRVPTRRGGQWSGSTVLNIVRRSGYNSVREMSYNINAQGSRI